MSFDQAPDRFLVYAAQDEVALRLLAAPQSGEDYRAMNVEVALYSHATYLFQVGFLFGLK